MRFPARWLEIVGAFFVAFGLGFIIFPSQLADLTTGAALTSPSAVIDMRAAHGGAPLGVGVFIALCARRRDWLRPGLIVALLTSAALGLSRLVGIVVDGSPNVPMVVALLFEMTLTTVSALGLRQLSRSQPHAG